MNTYVDMRTQMCYYVHDTIVPLGVYTMEFTFRKMYFALFNAITDAVRVLEADRVITPQATQALKILKDAQCQTEEMYIDLDDNIEFNGDNLKIVF